MSKNRHKRLRTITSAFALLALFGSVHAAQACSPPEVGDQLQFKNGPLLEIIKVNSNTCYMKLCVRTVGSQQACHWIDDPRTKIDWVWITKSERSI
jgi:hypothetical protein